jgi:hypothetical protein
MPSGNSKGGDTGWGKGLTYRYVKGQMRLMTMDLGENLYETDVPAPSLKAPYPRATEIAMWGKFGGEKQWMDVYPAPAGSKTNIFWDEKDQRLYWTFIDGYNTQEPDAPSIGYSGLNAATGMLTNFGPWRFSERFGKGTGGHKATNTGVISIPQWFVDAYTPGKRLAAGFGGYQSIVNTGPASLGPALTAFAPPALSKNPERSSVHFTNLVGYPAGGPRPKRDSDYYSVLGGDLNPEGGVGRWSWMDGGEVTGSCGVWVDTATKSGMLFFPNLGKGRQFYQNSQVHCQQSSHWWYVYDPADLGAVAKGVKRQNQIDASSSWRVEYPGTRYPLSLSYGQVADGAVYDPKTARLYLSLKFGESGMETGSQHMVVVYQVGDNIAVPSPAPSAPPSVVLSISPDHLPETLSFGSPWANGDRSDDTVYLTWAVSDATSVKLDNGIGDVSAWDTRVIKSVTQTTTYTLVAANAFGESRKSVTVGVTSKRK